MLFPFAIGCTQDLPISLVDNYLGFQRMSFFLATIIALLFFSTVAKPARVAEIQDEQGNQQGNVENAVVQPD